MTVLGGNAKHHWSEEDVKDKDETHQHYNDDDDVAGQISSHDACQLDDEYFARNQRRSRPDSKQYLKKFWQYFSEED
ncbi:MAG: hypothetical protein CL521_06015 [Actinobacteria bacterium]|nr:hypothetical protein [Actinomycetota bacterium]|tara:strand:+ start:266 stop:496 length:231 start_codon:yes stop_codon:yes gene_type:complete